MRKLRTLSRREREIMDVIYGAGSASASEIHERIPDPPSYSAVRATLRILETKGILRHEFDGKRYVYRPKLHRDKARAGAIEHLIATFFDGSATGAVMALLDRPDVEIPAEEVKRLTALIERARKEGR